MKCIRYRLVVGVLILTLLSTVCMAQNSAPKPKTQEQISYDQFKTETGFTGKMEFKYNPYVLRSLRGTFPDSSFTIKSEDTKYKDIAYQLITLVLPYIYVPREQIIYEGITPGIKSGFRVNFRREISGIKFRGGEGFLEIYVTVGPLVKIDLINGLSVVEDLVPQMTITKEQAIEMIYPLEKKNNEYHNLDGVEKIAPTAELQYSQLDWVRSSKANLIWYVYWNNYEIAVDAVTGKVLWASTTVIE